MADIELATGRIFKHHILNVPESSNVNKNLKCHQNENVMPPSGPCRPNPKRKLLRTTPPPHQPPSQHPQAIHPPRKLNRATPPPQQQQAGAQQVQAMSAAEAQIAALNKIVLANVKVPNPTRPKAAQKQLPVDQNRLVDQNRQVDQNRPNVIGQKRSRQTTSPDIVVVDLETKVEASSPEPSYQQGF